MTYVDWGPFFATWQIRGKYPNRGYPKVLDCPVVGKEAKALLDDAMAMMHDAPLVAKGSVAIYPCHKGGEDLEVNGHQFSFFEAATWRVLESSRYGT